MLSVLLCLRPRVRNKGSYNNSHLPAAVERRSLDVAPDALLREEGYLDAAGAAKDQHVLLQVYDTLEAAELVEAE